MKKIFSLLLVTVIFITLTAPIVYASKLPSKLIKPPGGTIIPPGGFPKLPKDDGLFDPPGIKFPGDGKLKLPDDKKGR